MKIIMNIVFVAVFNLVPFNQLKAEEIIPHDFTGVWGENDQCIAYHRNVGLFELEHNGHFYMQDEGKKVITHWFLKPRYKDNIWYLISDLKKDVRPVMGVIYLNEDKHIMEYWGINDSAQNAIKLRKCTTADVIKGIGIDPLKSKNANLQRARHISFALGYAMGVTQECRGLKIHDDTAKYIASLSMDAALRYANQENKLPAEKWVENFVSERTLSAISVARFDKKEIPNFCSEAKKAFGQNGKIIDGLIVIY